MARSRVDVLLGATGVGLAAAAVWFPWHVYLSPKGFGPPQMELTRYDDDSESTLVALGLPPALLPSGQPDLGPGIDRTITGSIREPKVAPGEITVLFASTGSAVVRRSTRLELWHPGSLVARDVRVVAITSDTVELSDGRTLRPSGPRK